MSDSQQLSLEGEVQITDFLHLEKILVGLGAKQMADKAQKLAERHKLPGMVTMVELLNAEASKLMHEAQVLNLRFAAKSGLNTFDNALFLQLRNGGVWLVSRSDNEPEEAA